MEEIGGVRNLVAGLGAGFGGLALGAGIFYRRIVCLRKEALDVVNLARELAEKYAQVDEDARRLSIEIAEFVASAKELRKGLSK